MALFQLMTGILFWALAGCEVFTNKECDRLGESWCEDGLIYHCENQEDGLHGSGSSLFKGECDEGSTCVEWGGDDASCIEDDACDGKAGFCHNGTLAMCPEGGGLPELRECGEELEEGEYCVDDGQAAQCAYREETCFPEGSSWCWYPERNFLTCSDGYWTVLQACLFGESCVQTSETEVVCFLQTLPGW